MPQCCLCGMAEKSLILIRGQVLGMLRIALAPHLFVHCVCLKSLASYLYTDLDDSFNECPDAASRLAAFSEKKADSLDLQAFCVSFVTFFRENYNERKRPFFHLCAQVIHFLSSLFPPTAFPPTLPFHLLSRRLPPPREVPAQGLLRLRSLPLLLGSQSRLLSRPPQRRLRQPALLLRRPPRRGPTHHPGGRRRTEPRHFRGNAPR